MQSSTLNKTWLFSKETVSVIFHDPQVQIYRFSSAVTKFCAMNLTLND